METKDNYHTLNELYDHRAILFAIICKQNRNIAWKSLCHNDGTNEEGWFIAGLETPYGQITYHQKIEFWNLFDVKILNRAPIFDGHTSNDVLERMKLFFLGNIL